jgi:hypothetical protein
MKEVLAAMTAALLFLACSGGAGVEVSRSQFEGVWPFTVERGTVDCLDSLAAVFIHDGTIYALTGFAQTRGYVPLEPWTPIWLDDPELPPWPDGFRSKVYLGDITELALEQC